MALKEYCVDGRTYLFEDRDVPEGAELVGEESPKAKPAKSGGKPANKAADAPEDK